ncbi:Ski6-PA [Coccidioides immitis RMSCC 3703]|uniref:Ski6-PA n=1 Tax=Coccidioides immitis RMSCC 3703 TaxID=454286 RepID=A0A0J8R4U7_COCIT|nr:Ski6-PA [Coccidioides immitis RMSCC 3703]
MNSNSYNLDKLRLNSLDAGIPMPGLLCACTVGMSGRASTPAAELAQSRVGGINESLDPLLDLSRPEELELPHMTVANTNPVAGASEEGEEEEQMLSIVRMESGVHISYLETVFAVGIDGYAVEWGGREEKDLFVAQWDMKAPGPFALLDKPRENSSPASGDPHSFRHFLNDSRITAHFRVPYLVLPEWGATGITVAIDRCRNIGPSWHIALNILWLMAHRVVFLSMITCDRGTSGEFYFQPARNWEGIHKVFDRPKGQKSSITGLVDIKRWCHLPSMAREPYSPWVML